MNYYADLLISSRKEKCVLPQARRESWDEIPEFQKPWSVLRSVSLSMQNQNLFNHIEEGEWDGWLIGELFGYKDKGHVCTSRELFQAFMADLRAEEIKPETLNGHFLIFAFNHKKKEWHVFTNRMGTMHCYYTTGRRNFSFGNYFAAVADSGSFKSLDWLGLTGFFSFGYFPQDRTYFEDVKIIRPATHIIFGDEGKILKNERYWNWYYEPQNVSYQDCLARFKSTFRDIIKDQSRTGRLAIPISGGLDSRTVIAATSADETLKERLWAYSYGYTSYSPEIEIGRKIASKRNLAFESYVIPSYLFQKMENIFKSIEGFQEVAATRQCAISDKIAQHAEFLLAAHWGDVWMDDMGTPKQGPKIMSHQELVRFIAKKIQKKGFEWFDENVLREKLKHQNLQEIRDAFISEELKPYSHIQDSDFRVKIYKTEQWSFRWTLASVRMYQPGAFIRLPYYDNRMVDFCCQTKRDYVEKRQLQVDYLKQNESDLAGITWEVTGRSLFQSPPPKWLDLSLRIYKKIKRIVLNRPHIGRNWEGQLLKKEGRSNVKKLLTSNDLKGHRFIPQRLMKKMVGQFFKSPSRENGYVITMLLTFFICVEKLTTLKPTITMLSVKWPPQLFIWQAVKQLAKRGFKIDLGVVFSIKTIHKEQIPLNVEIINLPKWSGSRIKRITVLIKLIIKKMITHPKQLFCLVRIIKSRCSHSEIGLWIKHLYRALPLLGSDSNLIHFQWTMGLQVYAPLRWLADRPTLVSCRGGQINIGPHVPPTEIVRQSLNKVFENATAVHCVSQNIKSEAMKYGLGQSKAYIIRPGVDPNYYYPNAKKAPQSGALNILSIGSLEWRKGYEYALSTMAEFKIKGIPIKYHIVGGGPDMQRLLFTIQDLGIEDIVTLYGHLDHKQVRDTLWLADVFLLASHSEGIANVALEAMACGLPVVTTNCGGMEELIRHGEEGFIVPVRDSHAMAHALEELIQNKSLRESMGKKSRTRIEEEFSLKKHVQEFDELYIHLANQKAQESDRGK